MTRNLYDRTRKSVQDWLAALESAAASFAPKVSWTTEDR